MTDDTILSLREKLGRLRAKYERRGRQLDAALAKLEHVTETLAAERSIQQAMVRRRKQDAIRAGYRNGAH